MLSYGVVKSLVIPKERETVKPRGFAFVEMAEAKDKDSVISKLDGVQWLGCQLRVAKLDPKLITRPLALKVALAAIATAGLAVVEFSKPPDLEVWA